jgi:ADP-ribosylglycohydrolase
VALAYKDSSPEVLERAVREACMFSHSHVIGMDGARVAAAAVAWLANRPRRSPQGRERANDGPTALLSHLRGIAQTEDMRGKLDLLTQNIFQVWAAAWRMNCESQSLCLSVCVVIVVR